MQYVTRFPLLTATSAYFQGLLYVSDKFVHGGFCSDPPYANLGLLLDILLPLARFDRPGLAPFRPRLGRPGVIHRPRVALDDGVEVATASQY